MLSLRPNSNDWKDVRFSDKVHFGVGPQRRLQIIQQSDERHYADYIQELDRPDKKDLYQILA
jgi:hypothetical protein